MFGYDLFSFVWLYFQRIRIGGYDNLKAYPRKINRLKRKSFFLEGFVERSFGICEETEKIRIKLKIWCREAKICFGGVVFFFMVDRSKKRKGKKCEFSIGYYLVIPP